MWAIGSTRSRRPCLGRGALRHLRSTAVPTSCTAIAPASLRDHARAQPRCIDVLEGHRNRARAIERFVGATFRGAAGVKPVTFVADEDQALKALKGESFEVQVGVHELLGHGSGKLFHRGTPDAERLLADKVAHPLHGEPVSGPFYAPGATWDSTFGKLASAYEECRAECTGIYLCLEARVLSVFGHDGESGAGAPGSVHDVAYINWLLMARAGLAGLEFYTPETKSWRQAHMQARYVILRVLLEAGDGLVSLESGVADDDGKPDVTVRVARDKVATVGRKAVGSFLLQLQTHKSLGDVEVGKAMFSRYAEVPAEMAALREVVMARKEPRKLLVQPHMHADGAGGVALRQFDESTHGMVESFVCIFSGKSNAK